MGNLNCIEDHVGNKDVNGELNGEVKPNRDSIPCKQFGFRRRRKRSNTEEDERNYFSSIKIFDRQRSYNRSKDSKESKEGQNSCPLCTDKTVIYNEQETDGQEASANIRNKSLLQPPFKPLSTPGESLNDNEVILIKSSWTYLKPQLNTILIESFMSLFAENSDVKEKFYSFKNHAIEDLNKKRGGGLASANGLQRHIPRVSRAITKVVNHVENLDQVTGYLEMLGKIHQQIGIEVQELMMLGAFFTSSSIRHLPSSMQNDRHYSDSWLHLFTVISTMMRKGYPSLEVEFDLSPEEKRCVQRTLPIVQRAASRVGPSSILKMFETYPNSMVYFADFRDMTIDGLTVDHPPLCKHGLAFVKFIEEISADLDDRSQFESKLAQLGQMHENLGIPKQYLEVMGPIFCQTIRPVLMAASAMPSTLNTTSIPQTSTSSNIVSSATTSSMESIMKTPCTNTSSFWSRDSRSAWLRFFRIIAFQMKRGYLGVPKNNDQDNPTSGALEADSAKGNAETDTSIGGGLTKSTNQQSTGSSDKSQYLLLHHPSTTSEGSHITKKRLARHKMLAISGFTSGFTKSFDVSSGCPITGQNISGPSHNPGSSSTPFVISDSHAQRKAMFLKQYYHQPNRRVSIADESFNVTSCGYVSPPFGGVNSTIMETPGPSILSSPKYQNKPISPFDSQDNNIPHSNSGRTDFTFPATLEACSPSQLQAMRRGSSCEVTGLNPFYHNRGRRQSTDLYPRKKHSLDNQLTIDSISSQLHIGI